MQTDTVRQPLHLPARLIGAVLAALMAALVLAIGGVVSANAYQSAVQAGEVALIQSAQQVGEVVHQDLRNRMIGNDRSNIQYILANAEVLAARRRVMVIGPGGHVYLDSAVQSQGETLAKTLPHCAECHRNAEPPTVAASLAYNADLIRVATPINNDTRCTSCHASSNAYLGVVLIDVSRSGVIAEAQHTLWIGLGVAFGLALVTGGGAFWSLRFVRLPVITLRLPLWRLPSLPLPLSLNGWWLVGGAAAIGLVVFGGGAFTMHMEGNDSFCASCHTQPETAYVERSQASMVDLASAHTVENVACIECHSGAGLTGRAGAILEGANNAARFVVGQYHSPAAMTKRLDDANCLKCHAEVTATNEPARHYHFYLAGWLQAQPDAGGCASCHLAHVTGGQVETDFVHEVSTQIVCEQCHASAVETP